MTTTIQFLRSSEIYGSLKEAYDKLNTLSHKPGQPVVCYYKDSYSELTDCILAVGVNEGIGKTSYSIISTGGLILVDGIKEGLIDISKTTGNRIYLCKVPDDNTIRWVYSLGSTRKEVIITNDNPKLVLNLEDNSYWWVDSKSIKKASDFVSSGELSDIITRVSNLETWKNNTTPKITNLEAKMDHIINSFFNLSISADYGETLFRKGEVIDYTVSSLKIFLGNVDITSVCTLYHKRLIGDLGFSIIEKTEDTFDGESYNLLFPGLNQDENIIIKAEYNDFVGYLEFNIRFVRPTLSGHLYSNDFPGMKLSLENNEIKKIIQEGSFTINNDGKLGLVERASCNYMSVNDGENYSQQTSLTIKDYPYLASPFVEYDIIVYDSFGQDITADFYKFSDISLSFDSDYNLASSGQIINPINLPYTIYVKKTPINSQGEQITIQYKPIKN